MSDGIVPSILNLGSVLWFLQRLEVGHIVNVSEAYAAFILRIEFFYFLLSFLFNNVVNAPQA
jgi:hypothetical protein